MRVLNFLALVTLTVFVGVLAFRGPMVQIVENTNTSEKETKVTEITKVEQQSSGPLDSKSEIKNEDESGYKQPNDDHDKPVKKPKYDPETDDLWTECVTVKPQELVLSIWSEKRRAEKDDARAQCANACIDTNRTCIDNGDIDDDNDDECYCRLRGGYTAFLDERGWVLLNQVKRSE